MRKYHEDFNEDYDRGYEEGRRDALRELNEWASDGKNDALAKTLGMAKKEIAYRGGYRTAYEMFPLYVVITGEEDGDYAVKVNPLAKDLIKDAVGDKSKGSLDPRDVKRYAEAFDTVYTFLKKSGRI